MSSMHAGISINKKANVTNNMTSIRGTALLTVKNGSILSVSGHFASEDACVKTTLGRDFRSSSSSCTELFISSIEMSILEDFFIVSRFLTSSLRKVNELEFTLRRIH
ncbi:hypothetical protein ACH5RR_041772 [Cinchona calisaya]|uniref:Uncharacterized protein n=1 Tax=Cinchona calisaya TaxID=153742 RepID=A0ABD2XXN8_9GENT